jgi:multiple sugar transport system permease protein/raffinose/stachyose/melibiose transport system permease protein
MRRKRFELKKVIAFISMVLLAIVMLYPFFFMISTSLKSKAQYFGAPGHSLDSWKKLFSVLPVGKQLLNSTIVCAGSIFIILIVSTMAGFAMAKLRSKASPIIFLGIVGAMLIPLQSIIIPAYINASKLNLLSGYWGAIFVYAALGTPFATFLMTSYFRGIPDDLVEAAVVDGLSYYGTFLRIALPLAVPAIITVIVLQFIQIWDDLLVGLLFIQEPAYRTITVGLGALSAGRVTDIPVLMAGSIVSAIPAVAVYLIFQRQLVNGLTAGIGK